VKIKIIHEKCDASLSLDKSLPCTAYLVEYTENEETFFDIVVGSKRVDIFDHYYDKYKKGFINMTQTEGRVNPKLWGAQQPKKSSK